MESELIEDGPGRWNVGIASEKIFLLRNGQKYSEILRITVIWPMCKLVGRDFTGGNGGNGDFFETSWLVEVEGNFCCVERRGKARKEVESRGLNLD